MANGPFFEQRNAQVACEGHRLYVSAMATSSTDDARARALRILTLDGSGGLVAGALVLALHGHVARFYGLSVGVVCFVAVVNLAYGAYSSTLVWRASRGVFPSRRAVEVLIVANAFWPLVCASVLFATRGSASIFGQLHLALEGLYVLGLAVVEARYVRPHTLEARG